MLVHDGRAPRAGTSGRGQIDGWFANYVTLDFQDFVKRYWNSRGIVAIIDEASDVSQDKEDVNELRKIMQRGRHNLNKNILITQHYKGVDKRSREQCMEAMIFKVYPESAKELSVMYGPEVANAFQLQPLEYFYYQGGAVATSKNKIEIPK